MKRNKKNYSQAEKTNALSLIKHGHRMVDVSRDENIPVGTLSRWASEEKRGAPYYKKTRKNGRKRYKKLSPETREQVLALAGTRTAASIARKFGVSATTITRIKQEAGLTNGKVHKVKRKSSSTTPKEELLGYVGRLLTLVEKMVD